MTSLPLSNSYRTSPDGSDSGNATTSAHVSNRWLVAVNRGRSVSIVDMSITLS